jgi:hypothetical protein
MMPDPMSMSSEDRIRRLMGSLPSMQAPPMEPTPDIEPGPMGDFSPQAQGGFEFDQHAGGLNQDITQAAPRQSSNPQYDAMQAEKAAAYQRAKMERQDAYAQDKQAKMAAYRNSRNY